eukprot:jgi/Botrbrau1/20082/Bobra.200_1s0085.1
MFPQLQLVRDRSRATSWFLAPCFRLPVTRDEDASSSRLKKDVVNHQQLLTERSHPWQGQGVGEASCISSGSDDWTNLRKSASTFSSEEPKLAVRATSTDESGTTSTTFVSLASGNPDTEGGARFPTDDPLFADPIALSEDDPSFSTDDTAFAEEGPSVAKKSALPREDTSKTDPMGNPEAWTRAPLTPEVGGRLRTGTCVATSPVSQFESACSTPACDISREPTSSAACMYQDPDVSSTIPACAAEEVAQPGHSRDGDQDLCKSPSVDAELPSVSFSTATYGKCASGPTSCPPYDIYDPRQPASAFFPEHHPGNGRLWTSPCSTWEDPNDGQNDDDMDCSGAGNGPISGVECANIREGSPLSAHPWIPSWESMACLDATEDEHGGVSAPPSPGLSCGTPYSHSQLGSHEDEEKESSASDDLSDGGLSAGEDHYETENADPLHSRFRAAVIQAVRNQLEVEAEKKLLRKLAEATGAAAAGQVLPTEAKWAEGAGRPMEATTRCLTDCFERAIQDAMEARTSPAAFESASGATDSVITQPSLPLADGEMSGQDQVEASLGSTCRKLADYFDRAVHEAMDSLPADKTTEQGTVGNVAQPMLPEGSQQNAGFQSRRRLAKTFERVFQQTGMEERLKAAGLIKRESGVELGSASGFVPHRWRLGQDFELVLQQVSPSKVTDDGNAPPTLSPAPASHDTPSPLQHLAPAGGSAKSTVTMQTTPRVTGVVRLAVTALDKVGDQAIAPTSPENPPGAQLPDITSKPASRLVSGPKSPALGWLRSLTPRSSPLSKSHGIAEESRTKTADGESSAAEQPGRTPWVTPPGTPQAEHGKSSTTIASPSLKRKLFQQDSSDVDTPPTSLQMASPKCSATPFAIPTPASAATEYFSPDTELRSSAALELCTKAPDEAMLTHADGRGQEELSQEATLRAPVDPNTNPPPSWGPSGNHVPREAFDDLLGSLVSIHSGFDELIETIPLGLDDLRASTSSLFGRRSLEFGPDGNGNPFSRSSWFGRSSDVPFPPTPAATSHSPDTHSQPVQPGGSGDLPSPATPLTQGTRSLDTPMSKEEALAAAERSLVDRCHDSVDDILELMLAVDSHDLWDLLSPGTSMTLTQGDAVLESFEVEECTLDSPLHQGGETSSNSSGAADGNAKPLAERTSNIPASGGGDAPLALRSLPRIRVGRTHASTGNPRKAAGLPAIPTLPARYAALRSSAHSQVHMSLPVAPSCLRATNSLSSSLDSSDMGRRFLRGQGTRDRGPGSRLGNFRGRSTRSIGPRQSPLGPRAAVRLPVPELPTEVEVAAITSGAITPRTVSRSSSDCTALLSPSSSTPDPSPYSKEATRQYAPVFSSEELKPSSPLQATTVGAPKVVAGRPRVLLATELPPLEEANSPRSCDSSPSKRIGQVVASIQEELLARVSMDSNRGGGTRPFIPQLTKSMEVKDIISMFQAVSKTSVSDQAKGVRLSNEGVPPLAPRTMINYESGATRGQAGHPAPWRC